jgi:hypothetical protein
MQNERFDKKQQATPFIMTYFCAFTFKFPAGMQKWGPTLKM